MPRPAAGFFWPATRAVKIGRRRSKKDGQLTAIKETRSFFLDNLLAGIGRTHRDRMRPDGSDGFRACLKNSGASLRPAMNGRLAREKKGARRPKRQAGRLPHYIFQTRSQS